MTADDLTDEACTVCDCHGIETEATEVERHVTPDGRGSLHRSGEPEPMCHECAEQSRVYPYTEKESQP